MPSGFHSHDFTKSELLRETSSAQSADQADEGWDYSRLDKPLADGQESNAGFSGIELSNLNNSPQLLWSNEEHGLSLGVSDFNAVFGKSSENSFSAFHLPKTSLPVYTSPENDNTPLAFHCSKPLMSSEEWAQLSCTLSPLQTQSLDESGARSHEVCEPAAFELREEFPNAWRLFRNGKRMHNNRLLEDGHGERKLEFINTIIESPSQCLRYSDLDLSQWPDNNARSVASDLVKRHPELFEQTGIGIRVKPPHQITVIPHA